MNGDRNCVTLPASRRDVLGLGAAAAGLAMADPALALYTPPRRGLQSLGYVVAPGEDLDAWSTWAPKVFALQQSDASSSTRVFRMDDYEYRFAIDRTVKTPTFGWEVADGAALDAMAARIEAGGVKVTKGTSALAAQRGVRELITLTDPAGYGVEIFHGASRAATPFKPARSMAGFRTGQLGMGHFAMMVVPEVFSRTSEFYRNLLGFRLSDYSTFNGVRAVEFMHINPREHSLVIIASDNGTNHLHHLMMEMQFMDDVGHAWDIVQKDYFNDISLMLGRHFNDLMTSFYVRTPSGFLMECGWGGLLIDPENWQADEMKAGGSIWGHTLMLDGKEVDDTFLPPAPERALRAPLQVHGDNFQLGFRPTAQNQVLVTEPVE